MERTLQNAASCSGRSHQGVLHNGAAVIYRSRRAVFPRSRAHVCQVQNVQYNFAEAAEDRVPGVRRNRRVMKSDARDMLEVVRGLSQMSAKQLVAVGHLLPPGTLEAIAIAARLPRSNQGRKRQEALVAKMLRGALSDEQIKHLEDAVEVASEHNGMYIDTRVENLQAAWREGLLVNDQATESEVYGYPRDWSPDHQQLRALVRQCQQALEEERAAKQAAQPGQQLAEKPMWNEEKSEADASDGGVSDSADEVFSGLPTRRSKPSQLKSRPLLRSLGKMLRPLAIKVVQQGAEDVV